MQKIILFSLILTSLLSCKKQTIELPVSQSSTVTVSSAVTDPVNYPPAVINVKTNATQLNYGSLILVKSTNLLLTNITPENMSNSSIHLYLKTTGKYFHLPYTTALGITYNYTLKSASPYCNVTITRTAGTAEYFDDVIIVVAKSSYLSSLNPALTFADYGNVKLKLGL